jgi:hypothetical protein
VQSKIGTGNQPGKEHFTVCAGEQKDSKPSQNTLEMADMEGKSQEKIAEHIEIEDSTLNTPHYSTLLVIGNR